MCCVNCCTTNASLTHKMSVCLVGVYLGVYTLGVSFLAELGFSEADQGRLKTACVTDDLLHRRVLRCAGTSPLRLCWTSYQQIASTTCPTSTSPVPTGHPLAVPSPALSSLQLPTMQCCTWLASRHRHRRLSEQLERSPVHTGVVHLDLA